MNKGILEAFAREADKRIETEPDLNEFPQVLTKVTVEHALNAELDDHWGTIKTSPSSTHTAVTAPLERSCVPEMVNSTRYADPSPIFNRLGFYRSLMVVYHN